MDPGCERVEQHLELFVLGEVDEAERFAVRAHLARCPGCSRALDEARRLLGMLDQRYGEEDRLARLRSRIDAEGRRRPAPPRVLRFPRRLTALAALLLLAVALAGPTPSGTPEADRLPKSEVMQAPGGARVMMATADPPLTFGEPVRLSGGAVVQPASGARWRRLPGNQVELTRGTLRVRVGPLGVQPVAVRGPSGTVVALAAEFTVTVRPGREPNASSLSVQTISGTVRQYPSSAGEP
jgi:ferric-dicitrate binding protein FerR (iron transport regulator)